MLVRPLCGMRLMEIRRNDLRCDIKAIMKNGHTGIVGIQAKQELTCRICGRIYIGHHLTKDCDDCRFRDCAALTCTNKVKRCKKNIYCSKECRESTPRSPNSNHGKKGSTRQKKLLICTLCGVGYLGNTNGGKVRKCDDCRLKKCANLLCSVKIKKNSSRQYCSRECRSSSPLPCQITCKVCGVVFKGKQGNWYCSDKCKSSDKAKQLAAEYVAKRFTTLRVSNEELMLKSVLEDLGFHHTGDRAFWCTWPDGTNHNPDYINEKDRKIVEYFGSYWHRKHIGMDDYIKEQWNAIGYECVIVWDYDRNEFLKDPITWGL
jgi:hypothetical protein